MSGNRWADQDNGCDLIHGSVDRCQVVEVAVGDVHPQLPQGDSVVRLADQQVAVSDVAWEAKVSEQTVYNYFQTKEQLVTDRDRQLQDQLTDLIRARPPGVSAAAAIRDYVLASVDAISDIAPEIRRGEVGNLAIMSPTVHRLSLEMTDRQAEAIADAISDTTSVRKEVAKIQGIALASVYQIIFSHAGRRTNEGRTQTEIAHELHPRAFSTNSTAGSISPPNPHAERADRPGIAPRWLSRSS